jgi:hypothetical protein
MRRKVFTIVLFFLVGLCPIRMWAADQKPETLENLIEEEVWIIFAHDPAGYLHDAWENLLNGDLRDAAYNIRKAKALLKLEAARAEKEAKNSLVTSIRQLEGLIKALEGGSAPTSKALRQTFAQTEYALSNHHHQKALGYGAKGDHEKATYALDAAATHLMYGSVWAGRELDQNDAVAAKEARAIARKAKRGEKWSLNRLREALKGLGRGIKKLGTRLKKGNEGP